MTVSFYVDESGHSGDLVKTGNTYDFLDQPYFSLACVGVEDEERLALLVSELKVRHRFAHTQAYANAHQNAPGDSVNSTSTNSMKSKPAIRTTRTSTNKRYR
ncbi:DUF3800 domain-containing protein [Paraburkholderia sp. WS6]|uniref:DUF3800 domain-containing protein n=1 Tax=Paraburkholderia TaxID=1822464 RepID=UPI0034637AAF